MEIAMYDLEGYLLEVFNVSSIVELEERLNIPQGALNNCIKGSVLTTIDRQFREVKSKRRLINKIGDVSNCTKSHINPVHKYYKGVYICSYPSVSIAADKNKIEYSSITKCCRGIYVTAGGFEWKYAK